MKYSPPIINDEHVIKFGKLISRATDQGIRNAEIYNCENIPHDVYRKMVLDEITKEFIKFMKRKEFIHYLKWIKFEFIKLYTSEQGVIRASYKIGDNVILEIQPATMVEEIFRTHLVKAYNRFLIIDFIIT